MGRSQEQSGDAHGADEDPVIDLSPAMLFLKIFEQAGRLVVKGKHEFKDRLTRDEGES